MGIENICIPQVTGLRIPVSPYITYYRGLECRPLECRPFKYRQYNHSVNPEKINLVFLFMSAAWQTIFKKSILVV